MATDAAAPATWRGLLTEAEEHLGARHEARILVEEASGARGAAFLVALGAPAPAEDAERLATLVARRAAGEPLQHVLGHWSFRSLDLLTDSRALVPRPETEVVVELALRELVRIREESGEALLRATDLGTGSGAIACALVDEDARVRVDAIEVSPAALELAAANRDRLPEEARARLRITPGDWFGGLDATEQGRYALVVANPPYVAAAEWIGLDPVVRRHDPIEALVAGVGGFAAIERIVSNAGAWLRPNGALVLELAPRLAPATLALAVESGASYAVVEADLAGRERVLVARY